MGEQICATEPAILEALLLQASGSWRSLEQLANQGAGSREPLAAALLSALGSSPLESPDRGATSLSDLEALNPRSACALALSRSLLALAQEQLLLDQPGRARASLRQALASTVNAVEATGMPLPAHLVDQLLSQADPLKHTLASQLELALATSQGQLPAQLVLVLGMHRSGTSALAGLLVQAGLDGPLDPMPATPANPRGYWESLSEVKQSDQLLQQFASHWSSCWSLAQHGWNSQNDAVRGWRAAMLGLLRTNYPHGGRAVLKDPRLCVLLPALQPWLESGLISCAALLPVRHPAEVAASLHMAEGLPHGQALLLWLGHVFGAERHSRPLHRLIVNHQLLLSDPRAVLSRSGQLLEQADPSLPLPAHWNQEQASGFIDPQLWRQRANTAIPDWVRDEQAEGWYDLALRVHDVMVDPELKEHQRMASMDQLWLSWTSLAPLLPPRPAMALWLCRLDGQASPASGAPTPKACGVAGWLLEADLGPGGLQTPSQWERYQSSGAGLPFGLDCRLVAPFTPAQERGIAAALAPWLLRAESLRLQQRPVLVLRGAEQFSHPRFGPRALRLALDSALRQHGCAQPLLLLCWADAPVHGADAVIDSLRQPPANTPLNYEVFLRQAHHRGCPGGIWRIPAVLPPADPASGATINASAQLYQEWLQLESSWSTFWLQGASRAPVVLGSWSGHQRWWREPDAAPPPQLSIHAHAAVENDLHASWGSSQGQHLALAVHGFHEPVLRRILKHVPPGGAYNGLPAIDLYLTVPEDRFAASVELVRQLAWPRVQLFGVANRGRDIAPFLLKALPAAVANRHQYLVKVHTKQSTHLGDGEPWGEHLLNSLLSPSFLQQFTDQLENTSKLGLIAPSGTVLPCTLSLGCNRHHLLNLCRRHHVPPRTVLNSRFVAGSMLAGRLEALRPLLEHIPSLDAFEMEASQTDGTLAHAYERWIGVMAEHHGWQLEELPGSASAVPKFGYGWAEHPPIANPDR